MAELRCQSCGRVMLRMEKCTLCGGVPAAVPSTALEAVRNKIAAIQPRPTHLRVSPATLARLRQELGLHITDRVIVDPGAQPVLITT